MALHVPKYRLHKASGQALVQVNGRRIYLGKHGTDGSKEKYRRVIAEWLATVSEEPPIPAVAELGHYDLSINELLLAYWQFAEAYYVKDGELSCMRDALRPVRTLYGHSRARDFGPLALKAVRQRMIRVNDLSRGVVNHRIKRVFKWAVSEELVPSSVFEALRTVTGLRYGRTEARETEPVKPVPDDTVEATLPFVTPQIAAMIQLQRLTGMRPCEVVQMRPCDLDLSESIWIYEPFDHKSRWRGHVKQVPLGPKAQGILEPFLDRNPETFCFSPRESEQWRRERRSVHYASNRTTPVYPCELRRRDREKLARRRRQPKRPKRERYDTASYRRAITYGIQKGRCGSSTLASESTAAHPWDGGPETLRHRGGTGVVGPRAS